MKLEIIKAIQLIGDKMSPEEIQKAFGLEQSGDSYQPNDEPIEKINRKKKQRIGYTRYSKEELDELSVALEIYGEPKKAMQDKKWVKDFCKRYNRTGDAIRTQLHVLKNKKSTHLR